MSAAGVVAICPIQDECVLSPTTLCQSLNEPILIYVSMSDSMVPLRVFESDSIEAVKLQIQTCKGFVVKNQKLVCGGRELARRNSMIRDYGVTDGNVLHLVLRLSDLRVINVRTSCGKEFTFHVERSRDVGYVKCQIAKKKRGLVDLDDQEVFCDGEELEDQRLINDICKDNHAVIHLLVRKSAKIRSKLVEKNNFGLSIVEPKLNDLKVSVCDSETKGNLIAPIKSLNREIWLEPVIVNPSIGLSPLIRDMINSTFEGLDKGNYPMRSSEGMGGAYLMLDAAGKKYVSVFKPIDEEPMAVNNPQGLPLSVDGEGLKKGTKVEEGAFREVAAYVLDHPKTGACSFSGEDKGFAGVPPTVMVKCLHRGFNHIGSVSVKIGSLQMFVENDGSCEDMGPGTFPVEEVHKISVLDIRLANADRHAGNILMSKSEDGQTVLIPIDHGYCLPASFEDCTFDWLYWPQSHLPYNSATVQYIKTLNAERDIALLKFHGWDLSVECARTLHISTMLLKKGAEKRLTPFSIGSIMCRGALNKKSMIEEIVEEAQDSVLPGMSEAVFLETVGEIMDHRLDEITGK